MIKLQEFLNQEECDLTLVKRDFENKSEDSIVIRGANNFHWGCNLIKPEKKTKEEEEKEREEYEKKERAKYFWTDFVYPEEKKEDKFGDLSVALKNMDLTIKKGEFVCIIGEIGSGKSSILSSVLGDMLAENKHKDAPILVNEKLSYVQQSPWIQNKTIRENILFGLELDEERYAETIKLC